MTPDTAPAYGLWLLAFVNAAVFIIFALSFFKPQTSRDWRSFGAFSAFLVALYLLSGWLQSAYPGIDWFSHDAGHLPEMLFGWRVNPHFGPFHLLSFALIGGGFWLLSAAWQVLYLAQREGRLATTGPYAHVRHPQYLGFILILTGFLFQWPTILTLLMYPVLIWMYLRLAHSEEVEARARFGAEYDAWARRVPAFLPFGHKQRGAAT